jgi:hypothetical protein
VRFGVVGPFCPSVKVIPPFGPADDILTLWRLPKPVEFALQLQNNLFGGLAILLLENLEHLVRRTFVLDMYDAGGIDRLLDLGSEVAQGGFLTFKLPEDVGDSSATTLSTFVATSAG